MKRISALASKVSQIKKVALFFISPIFPCILEARADIPKNFRRFIERFVWKHQNSFEGFIYLYLKIVSSSLLFFLNPQIPGRGEAKAPLDPH